MSQKMCSDIIDAQVFYNKKTTNGNQQPTKLLYIFPNCTIVK